MGGVEHKDKSETHPPPGQANYCENKSEWIRIQKDREARKDTAEVIADRYYPGT